MGDKFSKVRSDGRSGHSPWSLGYLQSQWLDHKSAPLDGRYIFYFGGNHDRRSDGVRVLEWAAFGLNFIYQPNSNCEGLGGVLFMLIGLAYLVATAVLIGWPLSALRTFIETGYVPRIVKLVQMGACGLGAIVISIATYWIPMKLGAQRQTHGMGNVLDPIAKAIGDSTNVLVFTGAGVSVSSGIPDFSKSEWHMESN